jgi:hypothetical protein
MAGRQAERLPSERCGPEASRAHAGIPAALTCLPGPAPAPRSAGSWRCAGRRPCCLAPRESSGLVAITSQGFSLHGAAKGRTCLWNARRGGERSPHIWVWRLFQPCWQGAAARRARVLSPRAAAHSSTACQAKRQCSLRSVNLPCNCQPICCSGLGCPARALPAQPAVAPLQATPLPSLTSFTKLAMHGIERVATALSHIYTALLTVGHSLQLPVRHGARSNAPWLFLLTRR